MREHDSHVSTMPLPAGICQCASTDAEAYPTDPSDNSCPCPYLYGCTVPQGGPGPDGPADHSQYCGCPNYRQLGGTECNGTYWSTRCEIPAPPPASVQSPAAAGVTTSPAPSSSSPPAALPFPHQSPPTSSPAALSLPPAISPSHVRPPCSLPCRQACAPSLRWHDVCLHSSSCSWNLLHFMPAVFHEVLS